MFRRRKEDNIIRAKKGNKEAFINLIEENVDIILAEAYDEEGVGLAIMNRLQKSAGFDIINV